MSFKKFGLPYQGSKSNIAEKIIDLLPPADFFIDAFAGGCAMTHAALLSHKYKQVFPRDLFNAPSQI